MAIKIAGRSQNKLYKRQVLRRANAILVISTLEGVCAIRLRLSFQGIYLEDIKVSMSLSSQVQLICFNWYVDCIPCTSWPICTPVYSGDGKFGHPK